MHRIAGANPRNHAHRTGRFDLVDVDNARLLENTQMRGLLRLGNQAAKVRLRTLAQVILLNGTIAKIEKTKSEPELAVARALNHVVPLEDHQEAVRRALVQLQRRRYLRQSQRRFAFAKQIQNGESPVQSLNFVCTLRCCVSHFGLLFRALVTS